ncbi:MAG: DUF4430 domain-containing protein [Clostridia bacterium]|nr:DUF4430 domain-containing protein [Clostridia bacterium]
MRRIACALIALVLLLASCTAEGRFLTDVSASADGIISLRLIEAGAESVQELADTYLAENAGRGAEWYVITLRQYGFAFDPAAYLAALNKYVSENTISSATERQKIALVYISCGERENEFVKRTLSDSIGQMGVMSYIYGLHLLNNCASGDAADVKEVTDTLLSLRKGGGWAVTGSNPDVDVTAMALQALAPAYASDLRVHEAVDEALELLSSRQLENGGFASYGSENCESCAQVIMALTNLGIEPEKDARFIKNGNSAVDALLSYRTAEGAFRHVKDGPANNSAVTQAFYALVSVWRLRSGRGAFYNLDSQIVPNTRAEALLSAESEDGGLSYKAIVLISVGACALAACIALTIKGKRHVKNYVFVLAAAIVLGGLTLLTDFESVRSYYSPEDNSNKQYIGTVTLTVRCDIVAGTTDKEYIPADGVILPVTEVKLYEGDSVFDALTRAAREHSLQVENRGGALNAHGMVYIAGINYLYEREFGDMSGWIYHVNGVSPNVSCGDYLLADGDEVDWLYTLSLGEDVKDFVRQ